MIISKIEKNTKTLIGVLTIIAVLAAGYFLKAASSILVPMVLSIFLAFLLAPLFTLAQKLRIPYSLTLIIILAIILIFSTLIGAVIIYSFQTFRVQLPSYVSKLSSIYSKFMDYISRELKYEGNLSLFDLDEGLGSFLGQVLSEGTSIFSSSFLVLLYLVFILLERKYFPIKIQNIFKGGHRKRVVIIMEHINRDIGKYVRIKTFISVSTGILIWITLAIIGQDFALVWGVLAVFFNFIPTIGSILIVILITLMSLVQFYPESLGMVILVGASMTTIQMILGNIIDPRLQGARLNLSPLLIIFSLMIWGWLWGILGMFLAVPLTVAIKIICVNIPALRPIGILMGTGKEKTRGLLIRQKKQ